MSSEARSETDSESGDHDRKSRRHNNMRRRKRGGNRRYKPYGIVDDEEIQEETEPKKKSRRERLGMAPSNTTQFLLDDREARAEAEHESEQKYEAAERRRIRSISCGSGDGAANCSSYLPGSDQGGSSSEQESDADREFDQKYLEAKRDRIEKMSKSELEQELLERSRDQETLADKCGKFRTENRQLKELLTANGIPYKKVSNEEYPTSTTAPDQSCFSYSPQYESKSPTIAAS